MSTPPGNVTRGQGKTDIGATFRKVINLRRPVQILRRLRSSAPHSARNALPPLYTTALEYSTGSSFIAHGPHSSSPSGGFGYGSTRSTMALKFPQRSQSLLSSSVEEADEDDDSNNSNATTPRTPEIYSQESEGFSSTEHVDRVLKRIAAIEVEEADETTPLASNNESHRKGGNNHTKDYLKVKRKRPPRLHQCKDSYDVDDDEVASNEAFDNFYDAMQGGEQAGQSTSATNPNQVIPEVRVNLDPSDRLIEAMENLREVIVENTNVAKGGGRRRGRQSQGSAQPYRANGTPMGLKDDRLKIRREKVIVELRVVFLKIGEIDTLKEQYSADTFIQAKWREPALDGKTLEELKRVDFDKFWNPLLYIDNILGETKEATWLTATVNSRAEAYVLERRRVRGIFMENLELNDFPLDVQDLTVTITSERPDTEIDIIPDENEMSGINVQTFVDQQEWRLHEHIEVSKKVMTQEYSSSNRCHPALSVTCRAARRPGYFYWNVFLVMFFISALSFATFAVSPELPQNRLQLSFTLLLTSVAFKFVINQSLPKISYLTYMDKYVLLSLVILCVVCIWHAVVTVFTSHGAQFMAELERDVFVAFAVIYVICHLVFMFWLYFDACKRRRLMKQKDREYLEFLAKKKEWLEKTKDLHPNSRRQSTLLMHSVHAL